MKKVVNVKVGDVIEFPLYQFAPLRSGWNGWIFRAGIVDEIYIKNGVKCAKVRYCSRRAGRYELFGSLYQEHTVNVRFGRLFEYDVERERRFYLSAIEAEKNGEEVCWSEDIALLANNGII